MGVQKETRLQNQIRLAVSENFDNVILWRNHTGAFKSPNGQLVKFGLCPGSADLIGIALQDGVGRFVAMEIKLPGEKPRQDQVRFLERVRELGGISGAVTSVEEAIALLR